MLCQLTRAQAAAAKGLVAGSIRIFRENDVVLDGCTSDEVMIIVLFTFSPLTSRQGCLIPDVNNEDFIDIAGAKWLLIIEKEVSPK